MKFEIRNSKLKHGYTIIELVVVMGIIAILMLLSASAFVLLRDQAEVDQTAETLVSTIRDAQNRAVSIMPNKNDIDAKVWAVSITMNDFSLSSIYGTGDNKLGTLIESSQINPQGTTITVERDNGRGTIAPISSGYIAFAPPFAKTYPLSNSLCNAANNIPAKGAVVTDPAPSIGCTWWPSTKPTEEWEIKNGGATLLGSSESLVVTIERNSASTKVIIGGNGDAVIK